MKIYNVFSMHAWRKPYEKGRQRTLCVPTPARPHPLFPSFCLREREREQERERNCMWERGGGEHKEDLKKGCTTSHHIHTEALGSTGESSISSRAFHWVSPGVVLSVKSFITCWIADYILQELTAWGSQLQPGGVFLKSIFLNIWVELIEEVNFFLLLVEG